LACTFSEFHFIFHGLMPWLRSSPRGELERALTYRFVLQCAEFIAPRDRS
jgi:hypothetical protein